MVLEPHFIVLEVRVEFSSVILDSLICVSA